MGGSKPHPPMGANRYFSRQTHTFALSTPPTTHFYTFFTSFTYFSHAEINNISGTSKWGGRNPTPPLIFFKEKWGGRDPKWGGRTPPTPPANPTLAAGLLLRSLQPIKWDFASKFQQRCSHSIKSRIRFICRGLAPRPFTHRQLSSNGSCIKNFTFSN